MIESSRWPSFMSTVLIFCPLTLVTSYWSGGWYVSRASRTRRLSSGVLSKAGWLRAAGVLATERGCCVTEVRIGKVDLLHMDTEGDMFGDEEVEVIVQ